MDNRLLELCEKACIEYCKNGFVSEDPYKDFIREHKRLCYSDQEQINSYMRSFIEKYIKGHNLPWRDNRYLYGEAYGMNIIFNIDEIPKEVRILSVF